MALIEVNGLRKAFRVAERREGFLGALAGVVWRRHRIVQALAGIDFAIEPGELVGYIGRNGAGKSTTVKILAGILVPDAGHCRVAGRVPWRERRQHVQGIGVVFGQRTQLWWDLPVVESFELLGHIYRVERSVYRHRRDELVETLGLAGVLATPVRQLSLGQRMRCELAATLLHGPALLFLDEPTIGLDAAAKLAVRRFVATLAREHGVTVLLTTHDMDDVEALCQRVIVIDEGRIFVDGTIADLRARMGGQRRLTIDLAHEHGDPLAELAELEGAVVRREGTRVHVRYDPTRVATPELVARVAAHPEVHDLLLENPTIDEIVETLYRERAEA